ncbi:preprotein translocase subunit SecE [Candidatus Saganbacteria bacterium]|nr:preprotein translocase subunit SecE [Candidatus Saganbacteria bacterium]
MEEKKVGLVAAVGNYIKETQAEAKKVSWPDRKYIISATVIIVVMVLVLGFALMGIDYGLSQAVLMLTKAR